MAHEPDSAPGAQSLLTLAALALMLSAAALAFGRVFTGGSASLRLVTASLLSIGIAALLERRNLLVATIVSAAVLVVAIGLLVFPETTVWGLPCPRTLDAIGDAIGRVREQARVQVSPTVPLPPLFLAAVTAMWAAAFSAHALLARAGSPLLAMLPPVALVGFADTVLDDGGRPFFAVLFLLGVLAVVLIDGIRRMRQWGPVWPWKGRDGRQRRTPVRGVTRVAALAIGAAALLPGLLPGFGAGPLVELGSNDSSGRIDPFVSIEATLREKAPETLFSVRSPVRSYWRMLALDRYDAETATWETSDPQVLHGRTVSGASVLPGALPVTGTEQPDPSTVEQTVTILKDLPQGNTWLPMAYAPVSLEFPEGAFRYDPALTTAVAIDAIGSGTSYNVLSRIQAPTRAELEAVPSIASEVRNDPYTQLPEELANELDPIAQPIVRTAGATTPFDRVVAIQNYLLSDPFRYDIDASYERDPDAIVNFLTRDRRGFCQQFATAMALLVRDLGYPARVAVGYRPGHPIPGRPGVYNVTNQELHSWVEVLFPPYGWIAFEPTPDFTNPVAASSYLGTRDRASACSGNGCGAAGTNTGKGQNRDGGRVALPRAARNPNGVGTKGRSFQGGGGPVEIPAPERRFPAGTLLRIVALIALVVLILGPPLRVVARAIRVRRARGARAMVLAEYRAFGERAADLGLPRAPGETIEEYRRRIAGRVRFSDGHLDRVSATAANAAYGIDEPSEKDAGRLRSDARVALRDIRRSVGIAQRIRGRYRAQL
jgi:transglutaminase-like putative cysteine protease